MIEGLERKNRRERQVGLLLAGLRFQYLEMIAYVYKLVPGGLVEDPGLDFMIIDSICEQSHFDAIMNIHLGKFGLILFDPVIDLINGAFYKYFFVPGDFHFERCI